jgi:replicative DNA helicase
VEHVSSLPPSFGEITGAALSRLERRANGGEKAIPLPWPALAECFGGGLWPGMHVLVSGTGAGKTQFALQLALHAAEHGTPVAYVGLELDALQVFTRLVALRSKRLKWSELYRGEAAEGAIAEAAELASRIATLPLHVEEAPPGAYPASRLESLARALREKYPEETPGARPMLIVLDFLQLVGAEESNKRADLRERIGSAAYIARGVASRMNAAVLLVSSTARANYGATTNTGDAKPGHELMSDGTVRNADALVGLGKESGEIEYAADSVSVAIRRGDVACENGSSAVAFVAAKLRAGVPRWVPLTFNGTRLEEWPGGLSPMATKSAPARNTKPPAKPAKSDPESNEEGGEWP